MGNVLPAVVRGRLRRLRTLVREPEPVPSRQLCERTEVRTCACALDRGAERHDQVDMKQAAPLQLPHPRQKPRRRTGASLDARTRGAVKFGQRLLSPPVECPCAIRHNTTPKVTVARVRPPQLAARLVPGKSSASWRSQRAEQHFVRPVVVGSEVVAQDSLLISLPGAHVCGAATTAARSPRVERQPTRGAARSSRPAASMPTWVTIVYDFGGHFRPPMESLARHRWQPVARFFFAV